MLNQLEHEQIKTPTISFAFVDSIVQTTITTYTSNNVN